MKVSVLDLTGVAYVNDCVRVDVELRVNVPDDEKESSWDAVRRE